MMLRCLCVFLLAFGFYSQAAPLKLDFLKVGSRIYSNVVVIGANTTDLYFKHNEGISNVKLRQLDPQLQKRFDFDPAAAAAAEHQQELDDLSFRYNITSNVVARAAEAASAAKKAAITSASNIADPFSGDSLIGKPAPELPSQKWIGARPELKGKCAIIYFWAPWSIPSRRYIADLNELQKKYGARLIVVGVTSETEADVDNMQGPRLEFPCGIDPQAKIFGVAGVRSIPSVLLVDPTGIVRYAGHPAALNERAISALLRSETE